MRVESAFENSVYFGISASGVCKERENIEHNQLLSEANFTIRHLLG